MGLRQSSPSLALLALAVLVSTGLGWGQAHAESVLRARLNSDILSTEPGVKRDENTDAVLLHAVEGLVAFKEDATVGPLLAKSVDISKDGRTYTFHLRPGVKFHNGAPLTSAEVVWSLNRLLSPATHWRCLSEVDGHGPAKIVSLKALNASTVAVSLDQPSAMFLKTLARPDCGEAAIVHPSSVGPDGAWRGPVGTGPFKLGERRPGQFVDLIRFKEYAPLPGPRDGNTGGKHAEVDRVRFLVIPDASAARAALLAKALDVLDGVNPNELHALKGSGDVKIDIHPTNDVYALLLQTSNGPLKDIRVRRALALALDTAAIAKAATQNSARPNSSAVPVASPYHTATHSALPRSDVGAARKLLASSGFRGPPITLIANKRYPQMFDAAVLIQAMAQQAGIPMQIQVLDWAAQLDRYGKGAYQAMTFAYSGRLDPSLTYDAMIGPKAVDPRKVWDDGVAQSLLKSSMQSADKATRQAAFDRLNARMQEQKPLIVLYNPDHISAMRKSVVGFKGWAAVQQRLWGVSLH